MKAHSSVLSFQTSGAPRNADDLLGRMHYGALEGAGDAFHVAMPNLAGTAPHQLAWWADRACRSDTLMRGQTRLRWTQNEAFLFLSAQADPALPIESQSFQAYSTLLQVLREQGKPHPLRIWNYVARINELEQGVERYRRFNSGRRQAFQALGFSVAQGAPAACALGKRDGVLQIAVLAGTRAPIAIENPRQQSAYHYPAQYGIDAPVFSRAALFPQDRGGELLFISGTASIVGHQTRHIGDVRAQTLESLQNLRVLLEQAGQRGQRSHWTLADLKGRVYLRHAEDLDGVRAHLESLGMHEFSYLQADICREDLLVEIEADGQAGDAS